MHRYILKEIQRSYPFILLFILLNGEFAAASRYPGFHPYDQRYSDTHLVPVRDYVDLCETPDRLSGICKPLHDCWTKYMNILRTSCQFYGDIEFFCCPHQETHSTEQLPPVRHIQPIRIHTRPQQPARTVIRPLNVLINIVVPGLGSLIRTDVTTPFKDNDPSNVHVTRAASQPHDFYHTTKMSNIFSTSSSWNHNYNTQSVTNWKPNVTRSTTLSWNQATQLNFSQSTTSKPRTTRKSRPFNTTVHTTPSSTRQTSSRKPRSTRQSTSKPNSTRQTTSSWRSSSTKQTTSWSSTTRRTTFKPVSSTTTTRAPQRIHYTTKIQRQGELSTTRKPNDSPGPQMPNLQQQVSQAAVCGRKLVTRSTPTPKLQAFVLGGTNSEEQEWPWMASIHSWNQFGKSRFICGGSLVTTRHILTAAHCFDNKNSVSKYSAVLGVTNLTLVSDENSSKNHLSVSRIKIHDQYQERIYYHDIAMLLLAKTVRLNDQVATVCLPTTQDLISMNPQSPATVAGWGHTTFGGLSSNILQDAELQIMNFNRCQSSYDRFRTKSLPHGITSNMLCAGTPKGAGDACQGDSGGPLVVEKATKWIQIGTVSFGYQCGVEEYPGVYTKVSSYLSWIQKILQDY